MNETNETSHAMAGTAIGGIDLPMSDTLGLEDGGTGANERPWTGEEAHDILGCP